MGSKWSKRKLFALSLASFVIGAAVAAVVVYVAMQYRSKSAPVTPTSASPLTTHVLDTRRGLPGANITAQLYRLSGNFVAYDNSLPWTQISSRVTDNDGRIRDLVQANQFKKGVYKLHFKTKEYESSLGLDTFYPYVETVFRVEDPFAHHHVPILLNPYGYSTYRGS